MEGKRYGDVSDNNITSECLQVGSYEAICVLLVL